VELCFESRRAQAKLLENYCKVTETIRRMVRVLGKGSQKDSVLTICVTSQTRLPFAARVYSTEYIYVQFPFPTSLHVDLGLLMVRTRQAVMLEYRCRVIHAIRRTVGVVGEGGETESVLPIG
jgi:hypothetical protein